MWEFNPQDQSAVRIVAQMDELFAIDVQARQERLSQGIVSSCGWRNSSHSLGHE